MDIILASGSPRRLDILRKNGINPIVMPTNADESLPPEANSACEVAEVLSSRKAEECKLLLESTNVLIIAADTIVVLDECKKFNKFGILGKPAGIEEARMMISAIQGEKHEVITGCTLIYLGSDYCKKLSFHDVTEVYCKVMSDSEIEEYILSDEPYDKAGGYGIQGEFGKYIDHIVGDYDNVVGLPFNMLNDKLAVLLALPEA